MSQTKTVGGQKCDECGEYHDVHVKCPGLRCHTCCQLGHTSYACPGSLPSPRGQRQEKLLLSPPHDNTRKRNPQTLKDTGRGAIQQPQRPQRLSQSAHSRTQPQTSLRRRRSTQSAKTKSPPLSEHWKVLHECVRDWYPNLHSQTHFIPPFHFNKVPYDAQSVAGQTVLIPTLSPVPDNFVCRDPPPPPNPSHVASRVWSDHPGSSIPRVQSTDLADDRAMQQVLDNIRKLAESRQEVMMVISQLQFRKYLDNQIDPICAAATRLLPTPASIGFSFGEFDILIIHRTFGLIVGEVKSVGADPEHTTDQAVVKRVQTAMNQLKKADLVLPKLLSDVAPVNVIKTLMLPNITSTQLQQALGTDSKVENDLCTFLGAPDTPSAVARCLCADTLQKQCSVWWERAVTDHGPDKNMTDDIYETLVARFCGPATTVEVPTVTTPRCAVEMRTLTDAVAHTGLRMALLTLYPEQVELLNRPGLPRVFLWGPPGTGKTVVLTLKGLQWRHQNKDVHLLTSNRGSRAVIMLIEEQLLLAQGTTATTGDPRIHRHTYDFENKGDIESAIKTLAKAAIDGELYVIADEAFCGDDVFGTKGRFADLVTRLYALVPSLHLWAAAVRRDVIPPCMSEERLTTPVRCPPTVVEEVQWSKQINDDDVPNYRHSTIPAPTDGPPIKRLRHQEYTQGEFGIKPLPDHNGCRPEECERCGDDIAGVLADLRVGQPGQHLQYRDIVILCGKPRNDLPIVKRLRAKDFPVQVVTSDDDETTIRNVALAMRDVVTVTHHDTVSGLERRVVVVLGWGDPCETLYAMSRCTSFLVRFD